MEINSRTGELLLTTQGELDVLSAVFRSTDLGHQLNHDMPFEAIIGRFDHSGPGRKVPLSPEQEFHAKEVLNEYVIRRLGSQGVSARVAMRMKNEMQQLRQA